jgi:hypothetical protein
LSKSRNIAVFRSVHPNCIQLLKRLKMSEWRGWVKPRSGARALRLPLDKLGVAQAVWAAVPGRKRRAGKPRVVRETSLTRHPNLGAAKFG